MPEQSPANSAAQPEVSVGPLHALRASKLHQGLELIFSLKIKTVRFALPLAVHWSTDHPEQKRRTRLELLLIPPWKLHTHTIVGTINSTRCREVVALSPTIQI